MNIQQSNRESEKKYTVKTTEKNGRKKEKFARDIIHSLDTAIKNMENGVRGKPLDELLDELDKYVEQEKRKNNG